jgi:hypothetical protein
MSAGSAAIHLDILPQLFVGDELVRVMADGPANI